MTCGRRSRCTEPSPPPSCWSSEAWPSAFALRAIRPPGPSQEGMPGVHTDSGHPNPCSMVHQACATRRPRVQAPAGDLVLIVSTDLVSVHVPRIGQCDTLLRKIAFL